jgi:hypothetical protein
MLADLLCVPLAHKKFFAPHTSLLAWLPDLDLEEMRSSRLKLDRDDGREDDGDRR